MDTAIGDKPQHSPDPPTPPLPPPPPPKFKKSITEYPSISIKAQLLKLDLDEHHKIISLINGLKHEDLQSKYNHTVKDGISMRLDIVYDDSKIKQVILVNDATINQRKLIRYLLQTVVKKDAKNRSLIKQILN